MTLWRVKLVNGEERKVHAPGFMVAEHGELVLGENGPEKVIHHGLFGWVRTPTPVHRVSDLVIAPGQWLSVEAINRDTGEFKDGYAPNLESKGVE